MKPINNAIGWFEISTLEMEKAIAFYELARVKKAGGSIIRNKTLISEELGFMGLFFDSEGNRITLHSRK